MLHAHAKDLEARIDSAKAEADLADVTLTPEITYTAGLMIGIKMALTHPEAAIYLYTDVHKGPKPMSVVDNEVEGAVHELFCMDENCTAEDPR